MLECLKCGYKDQVLQWSKNLNTYTAKGNGTIYKIEKLENVYHVFWEGSKQRKQKHIILYSVKVCDDDINWSSGIGFNTLEESKDYCHKYEFIQ